MAKKILAVLLVALLIPASSLAASISVSTKDIVIDSPYGTFLDYGFDGSGIFTTDWTEGIFSVEKVEVAKDPFDFEARNTERIRILPLKAGKGKIIFKANGKKTTVNVTVKKTSLEKPDDFDALWFDNGELQIYCDDMRFTFENGIPKEELDFRINNGSDFPVKLIFESAYVNLTGDGESEWELEAAALSEAKSTMKVSFENRGYSSPEDIYLKEYRMELVLNTERSFDDTQKINKEFRSKP